jgi:hypothetical protein
MTGVADLLPRCAGGSCGDDLLATNPISQAPLRRFCASKGAAPSNITGAPPGSIV